MTKLLLLVMVQQEKAPSKCDSVMKKRSVLLFPTCGFFVKNK